jgi:hypothetical protein
MELGVSRAEDSPPVTRLKIYHEHQLVWAYTLPAQSGEYLHLRRVFSFIDPRRKNIPLPMNQLQEEVACCGRPETTTFYHAIPASTLSRAWKVGLKQRSSLGST